MLKKAGIVVAGTAATLLAISPLAFASGYDDDHGDEGDNYSSSTTGIDRSGEGLLNLSGNDIDVPFNVCDNQVPVNVLGVQVPLNNLDIQVADLLGGVGLLGGEAEEEAGDGSGATLDDSCSAGTGGDSIED